MALTLQTLDESQILADISTLETNVRAITTVSMGNADYTMTQSESESALLNIIDSAPGVTLYWATAASATVPALQIVSTAFLSDNIGVGIQGGAADNTLIAGSIYAVSAEYGYGVINATTFLASDARNSTNGTTTITDSSTTLTDAMLGKLLIFSKATAQTLTVPVTLLVASGLVTLKCIGAGGLTVISDGTTTIEGTATLTSGKSMQLARDTASPDTWHTLRGGA